MGTTSFTQVNRPIQISTTLGADVLLLAGFSGREAISEPFEFKVRMLSESGDIAAKDILRTAATISIQLPSGKLRYLNGVFRDFSRGGYDVRNKLYGYEGTLVPSLWFLSLGWNCKIFQTMSVPDIVEQVLKDNGVTDYELTVGGTYPTRDYCVQYRESNFNFISRLLEEEGISYYFAHSDSQHTLKIVDADISVGECTENEVSYSTTSEEGTVQPSTIFFLVSADQVYTPAIALTDYNFETPSMNLLASAKTINKTSGAEERFDYPGGYQDTSDGTRYGDVRIAEQETFASLIRGRGNCASFTSGYQFTLADHFRDTVNQTYLLTSVQHQAEIADYTSGDTEGVEYSNSFSAIPSEVDFTPPRRARKPVVYGTQTAVVVGASGEEIYVDKYGRVKVQFFWDREGQKDEKSSCWIRVAQIWAGKNWGWMTIPRIGQEVVVDFLEGDPDRPLIVGRVYNAEQMPPYTLPDNSTQSGILTRSSKGGSSSNANEIRFEDKMGNEMFTVHAEKDMTTEVENDDTQTVDRNRTITVKGTHTETITGNTSITIQQGNHSLTLDQGNQTTKVTVGSESHEALQQIELKVGQSSIVLTQQGITIKGMMISIEGTIQLEAKSVMTTVSADAIMTVKGALTMIN